VDKGRVPRLWERGWGEALKAGKGFHAFSRTTINFIRHITEEKFRSIEARSLTFGTDCYYFIRSSTGAGLQACDCSLFNPSC